MRLLARSGGSSIVASPRCAQGRLNCGDDLSSGLIRAHERNTTIIVVICLAGRTANRYSESEKRQRYKPRVIEEVTIGGLYPQLVGSGCQSLFRRQLLRPSQIRRIAHVGDQVRRKRWILDYKRCNLFAERITAVGKSPKYL